MCELRWEFIQGKRESKKKRKHALDQENDQEKKKVFRLKTSINLLSTTYNSLWHLTIRQI